MSILKNRSVSQATQSYPETVVSAGMRIEGDLKSSGAIHIDGVVSGKVHSAQNVEIGPNAQVDADVIARDATIGGIVKGNVTVKESLQILSTGRIIGNISCAILKVEEGGIINGNCRMQENKSSPDETEE